MARAKPTSQANKVFQYSGWVIDDGNSRQVLATRYSEFLERNCRLLGKGVRTVQRWEKHDGLPVRRIVGTSKIIVHREELDRWLHAQPAATIDSAHPLPDFEYVESNLRAARELRKSNASLRTSLTDTVIALTEQCRRMTNSCVDPSPSGSVIDIGPKSEIARPEHVSRRPS